MTFDEYQKRAITTDSFGGKAVSIMSPAFMSAMLGLCGESGEIAEKFKKYYRDTDGVLSAEELESLKKELGDVLWYINTLACYLGLNLEDIAHFNLDKVLSRKERGKIAGSGDDR